MMNRYQKLTEAIHTPAGLNDRVLFEARRRGGKQAAPSRREEESRRRPLPERTCAAAVPRNRTRDRKSVV